MAYIRFPFASLGDKTAVPATTQVDGTVSYQQGYGPNYGLDLASDPNALPLERDKFNQVMNDLSSSVQSLQQNSVPDFITSSENGGTAFSYGAGVRVRYNDGSGYKIYRSNVDSNTTDPTNTTNWSLDSASTAATETAAGIAEIATNAETIAGTDNTRFVTPAKLRYGFAMSMTANGYIAFPSWLGGFIVQWGSGTTDAGGNAQNFSLPLTFPNNYFAAVSSVNIINCMVRTRIDSTSTMSIFTYIPSSGGPYANVPFYWIGVGN